MIPYYFLYFMLIISALFAKRIYKDDKFKMNKFISIVGFVCVFTILALRHESMGVDLAYRDKNGYLGSFDIINTYSWKTVLTMDGYLNYEKGYIIFNKLIGSIINSRQFFIAVCAFVTLLPVSLLIYHNSKLPLLSYIVLFGLSVFFMFYTGLRQSIAIGITTYSFRFIKGHKLIPFIIAVLLAMQFHYTAVVFLIAYPVYSLKIKKDIVKIIMVIIIPCVFLFRNDLFTIFSRLLKEDAEIGSTGGGGLFFIFIAVYIFMIFFEKGSDEETHGSINLFYLACICQAFSGLNQGALRVGFYFMIYLIVALPNTVYKFKVKEYGSNREYITLYIVLFTVFAIYGLSCFYTSWVGSYPYKFFWQ